MTEFFWKIVRYSKVNTKKVGEFIRQSRKELGISQQQLAMVSGTGMRFIIDLEKGKETCQIGKVLHVLTTLGTEMNFENKKNNEEKL